MNAKTSKKKRDKVRALIAVFLWVYDVRCVESSRYEIAERDTGEVIAHIVLIDRKKRHEKATLDHAAVAHAGM